MVVSGVGGVGGFSQWLLLLLLTEIQCAFDIARKPSTEYRALKTENRKPTTAMSINMLRLTRLFCFVI